MQRGILRFAPDDLPSPIYEPIPCGSLQTGAADLFVTPGLQGRLVLEQDVSQQRPGHIVATPFRTDVPAAAVGIDREKLGELVLHFDGYAAGAARVVVSLEPAARGLTVARAALQVPRAGGTYCVRVSPGVYQVHVAPQFGEEAAIYVPWHVSLGAGERAEANFGGTFEARLCTLSWDRVARLWVDVADNRGNDVLQVPNQLRSSARLRVTRNGRLLREQQPQSAYARYFEVAQEWSEQADQQELTCEYLAQSQLLGSLRVQGDLPSGRDKDIWARLQPTFESESFAISLRQPDREAARRMALALEEAHAWLGRQYAGPVRPHQGARFRLTECTPLGMATSGGDAIGLGMYADHIVDPRRWEPATQALFHEFGHSFQSCPPHHQARGSGSDLCEAVASLLADYCIRAVHGEQGYRWTSQQWSSQFFESHVQQNRGQGDPNAYDFVFHYLHDRFGQNVNRQFFRAMYASENRLDTILLSAPSLRTEPERVAALYSWLTGENLGWLFRWAGFSVQDDTVARGVEHLKDQNALPPR
jgi:hypothetical protein